MQKKQKKKNSEVKGYSFLSVPRDTKKEVRIKVKKYLKALKKLGVYLSVSIKSKSGGYIAYNGIWNKFKESRTDPDFALYVKEAKKKAKDEDEDDEEDIDEEEDDDEDEEEDDEDDDEDDDDIPL